MSIWLIILALYLLMFIRLVWAVKSTWLSRRIKLQDLHSTLLTASELMIDGDILEVHSNRAEKSFQVRKRFLGPYSYALEAIIPFHLQTGSKEPPRILSEENIMRCSCLPDGVHIARINLNGASGKFKTSELGLRLSEGRTSTTFSVSRPYLLDARPPLKNRIKRFAGHPIHQVDHDICHLFSNPGTQIFSDQTEPHLSQSKPYLLTLGVGPNE